MLISVSSSFAQKKLTIVVDGMKSANSTLLIGLYNSDSTFLKTPVWSDAVKVAGESQEITTVLPEGTYAISLFEDVNGNYKLDTGAMGIPVEKFGFSNNVRGQMGVPTFEQCKFVLKDDQVVRIHLMEIKIPGQN